MRDGVRLSATIFTPVPKRDGEQFPTLLELLPYRKDDSFYLRDYPHYSWFASRGYRAVKVDVRGTGSSEGTLPDREYSEVELADAEQVVGQLGRLPGSNGRVGMWGISWGGFNAIQVAMRAPLALKAILAVDASDDLFHDDIHYIDGVMHVDMYQLEIDHENGLPRSPHYEVDAAYLRDRFERPPWLLRYMRQQRPGPFWSKGSLRGQYHRLGVPSFLIGGLSDGYRDSIPRMLENVPAPVQAWIGPWNHDFPDSGVPGPNAEWREEALRWFDRWLVDHEGTSASKPRLAVFVRGGHGPSPEGDAPGRWATEEWPIRRTRSWRLATGSGGHLVDGTLPSIATLASKDRPPQSPDLTGPSTPLVYRPGTGTAAGDWWGETPGDMVADDQNSVCFDSEPMSRPRTIIGSPLVQVCARVDSPLVHWSARLEDVAPDGSVTLVTGAAKNGSSSWGNIAFELPLHFTTWTFRKDHKVRLALTHSQFPMLWPTPFPTTSLIDLGPAGTGLSLPEVPDDGRPGPRFPPPGPLARRPDARDQSDEAAHPRRTFTDPRTGETCYRMESRSRFFIRDREHRTDGSLEWRVDPKVPSRARALGFMTTRIQQRERKLMLTTQFTVRSDATDFHVKFSRILTENGRVVGQRTWRESIPRDGH